MDRTEAASVAPEGQQGPKTQFPIDVIENLLPSNLCNLKSSRCRASEQVIRDILILLPNTQRQMTIHQGFCILENHSIQIDPSLNVRAICRDGGDLAQSVHFELMRDLTFTE